jgi:riboflavin kinase / FMN adenylyltransferase
LVRWLLLRRDSSWHSRNAWTARGSPACRCQMPESALPPSVIGAAVTVGTFDGVHRGHFDVLARLRDRAQQDGLASVLVTFAPHPAEVVKPSAVPMLLTPGLERIEALATIGIDYVAVVPFTRELANLSAVEFVSRVLLPRFRMRALLIGHDHGFGRDRAAGRSELIALGQAQGIPVEVVEPVRLSDGRPVSSSLIRHAVASGELAEAAAALGRPYSLSGVVQRGDGRGRTIGFPTANLGEPNPRKLLPPEGVYAAVAWTRGGPFRAMLNLGSRPTVADASRTVEAHLLDFRGDLYGHQIRLDLVSRLRPIVAFDGLQALSAQLHRDAEASRAALTTFPVTG